MSALGLKDISASSAENVVRSMGLVFNNTALYSPEHGVTKTAMDECFKVISSTLSDCGELTFSMSEDNLLVNGTLVALNNPLMQMFVKTLVALEIGSFSLSQGMDKETFLKMMDVMTSKPDELKAFGGFGAAVKSFNLENVKATRITVKQVAEDEEVKTKGSEDDAEVHERLAKKKAEDEADMMAFIKGDIESSDAITKNLTVVATDANKLSDLIIQATEMENKVADLSEGESYSDLIVNSLKRVYDAVAGDPAFKTQKGKNALKKALQQLEMTIFETLREHASFFTDADRTAIADSIEQMTDELEIESLAAEYMRKRAAIENNENRILRFIRAKGLDKIQDSDLEEKLSSGGLSLDAWQELLVKGTVSGELEQSATGIAAVGHLAMLLDQMEEGIKHVEEDKKGALDAENLEHLMTDVDKEVQKMVIRAEQKIRELVRQVQEEDQAEEEEARTGKPLEAKQSRMSRKKLMARLAEVVQELCQPISVIHCSIEMILAGCVGDVTPEQKDMLSLADESGKKLQVLIDHLLAISGVPKTLTPDKSIQESIYQ